MLKRKRSSVDEKRGKVQERKGQCSREKRAMLKIESGNADETKG